LQFPEEAGILDTLSLFRTKEKIMSKYKVEKLDTQATESGYWWVIWFHNHDVVFWSEDAANEACEALNAYANIKKLKRKAKDLAASLEVFNEE
jgi:hypothetical protein